MDVYFYEAFEEEAVWLNKIIENKFSYGITEKTIQEAAHINPPSKLISIRTQSIIPVDWATQLNGVQSRSTGYDHLKKYLIKIPTKIPCGYLQEYATRAVAEHAVMLAINLLRKLPKQVNQFQNFNRNNLTGAEICGKNLLIFGVGRIGSEIAQIGSALGMNVCGVDIVEKHNNIKYVDKYEGVRWADIIICSMNLTNENHNYFSYDFLKNTKKGFIFVNIARGEHAPLKDLHQLIFENHVGGIGLDVFEDEPNIASDLRNNKFNADLLQTINKLSKYSNVILTPHNAFNTIEAVQRKSAFSISEIEYFLNHKDFLTKVEV